ncbi:hypothetical protein NLJ89_g9623 [Agrocybe chaxingu]|uniref:Uncharacterized protein n=1 Tax=Agrocybe chaxingu TaxID=84603 RepID=A0A9W8MTD5_9AGAR|nr:hypothetical protein NLJ89_g9623 [Agrocybe chaxingu]
MSLGTFIPHFLYNVLKRIMPLPPDEDPELPSTYPDDTLHDVYPWKRAIVLHYCDRKSVQESQVSQINWYKSQHGFKHEYMVLTLTRPGRPTAYIRCERSPSSLREIRENAISDEDRDSFTEAEKSRFKKDCQHEEAVLKKLSRSGKMSTLTSLQLSVDGSKSISNGHRMASDTVTHVSQPNGTRADEKVKTPGLIASYTLFNPPLPLRDFALIANYVHRQDIKYQLLLKNCYWYCDTIMGIIRNLYGPTIDQGNSYQLAGQYLGKRLIYQSHQNTPDVISLISVVAEAKEAQDNYLLAKEEENSRADREAQRANDLARAALDMIKHNLNKKQGHSTLSAVPDQDATIFDASPLFSATVDVGSDTIPQHHVNPPTTFKVAPA